MWENSYNVTCPFSLYFVHIAILTFLPTRPDFSFLVHSVNYESEVYLIANQCILCFCQQPNHWVTLEIKNTSPPHTHTKIDSFLWIFLALFLISGKFFLFLFIYPQLVPSIHGKAMANPLSVVHLSWSYLCSVISDLFDISGTFWAYIFIISGVFLKCQPLCCS